MTKHDTRGVSDLDGLGKPETLSQHPGPILSVQEQNIAQRENTVIDDEAAVLGREILASAREDAMQMREFDTQIREEEVASREQEVRAAEAVHSASGDNLIRVQQANEHLVIATIEAQKLSEQLQIATAQLENAKFVAERANLAKSAFLSSMSHELRTPLNAILGFAQLLEAGSPPPTIGQGERLSHIIKAGWYLLDLINQILDLAVIESGKLSMSREPVSLIGVIRECQAMVASQAQNRGIRLDFLPFDTGWFANADRMRVKQILVNLLSNAIKYNRPNGTVEVACTAVGSDRLRICITDSGEGLSPEKLAQLFQPFNRLGRETGPEEGTGIGLVVTKQLVELMGGKIGVESTVGVGSCFWVELIRDAMPHLTRQSAPPLASASLATRLTPRTVLYVEDNPANLVLVEQIIEGHPHVRLLSACDATLGIALARTHLPDMILMDINLPGISGIEALQILHQDPVTAHIPIVALSANAMPRDVKKGLDAGFFRYLTKPIKVGPFMEVLDAVLERDSKPFQSL